jgi:hypothetical protein
MGKDGWQLNSAVRWNTESMKANQIDGQYVIDPRDYRADRFYFGFLVVFWTIWAPATAVATYMAFIEHEPFFYFWLIFGYLGTILIPYKVFTRYRKQVLKVTGESLAVYGTGILPTSSVKMHRRDVHALTLEHYGGGGRESIYTLNLLQKEGIRPGRIMLAAFVRPKDKAILLEEISSFLRNHGCVFEVKNEMETDMDSI